MGSLGQDDSAPAAPDALQGLGLSEDQAAGVKSYVWARLRLGGILRMVFVSCLVVVAAHLLMRAFVDDDPTAPVRTLIEVAVTEYMPYAEAALLVLAVAMLLSVRHRLRELDRELATALGLSARASAHVRRIARLATLREAFGDRIAGLVAHVVAPQDRGAA